MKRIIFVLALGLFFGACNPNQNNSEANKDSVNTVRPVDSANAGLTGTTNANGFLPADSNKSINPMGKSGSAEHPDSTQAGDSSK